MRLNCSKKVAADTQYYLGVSPCMNYDSMSIWDENGKELVFDIKTVRAAFIKLFTNTPGPK